MTNKQQETITTSNELLTREPFPASTKVYIEGKIHTDIKVPVREILLANETKLRWSRPAHARGRASPRR